MLETLLADIGKSLPVLRDILIEERDRYLVHKIRTAPGKKVVAVVGAGHVPGIKKYWNSEQLRNFGFWPDRSIRTILSGIK